MTDEATNAALREMAAGLGRMEGTLEGVRSEQTRLADECKAIRTDIGGRVGEIDGRVDGLERRREREMGAASVAGAVFGFAAAWIRGFFPGGGQ